MLPHDAEDDGQAEVFGTQVGAGSDEATGTNDGRSLDHRSALDRGAPVHRDRVAPLELCTARAEQFNSVFFLASRDNILNALKAKQPEVWFYQFNWDKEPAPWNDIYGAAHLFDLPFVFGNFGPSLMANIMNTTANKAGRLDLSDAMMKSIGSFAKNSDPNNATLGTAWPVWPQKLIFDATLTNKVISVQ